MKKILIVGENSYLASGLDFSLTDFQVDKIKRSFNQDNLWKYKSYDYVINFCIQPEHFCSLLSESEMIDVQIAKCIKGTKTKLVFLSSRKVYGLSTELKEFSETDELKPYDFYSKNKCNIETKLRSILKDNLLILRTGNIIGLPPNKKNYPTFIGWLETELRKNGKVIVTVNKNAKKDFITKEYFQAVLNKSVELDLTGVYNVGAGFALSTEELVTSLVSKELVEFDLNETQSEQFVLNCDKLHKKIRKFTKEELLMECSKVLSIIQNKYEKLS